MKEKRSITIVRCEINALYSCSAEDEIIYRSACIRGMIYALHKVNKLEFIEAYNLIGDLFDVCDYKLVTKSHKINEPIDFSLVELPF